VVVVVVPGIGACTRLAAKFVYVVLWSAVGLRDVLI
jgi:hypothetical protein